MTSPEVSSAVMPARYTVPLWLNTRQKRVPFSKRFTVKSEFRRKTGAPRQTLGDSSAASIPSRSQVIGQTPLADQRGADARQRG